MPLHKVPRTNLTEELGICTVLLQIPWGLDFLFKKNKNKRCFYSLVSPYILIQSYSIELVCVDIWSFNNNNKNLSQRIYWYGPMLILCLLRKVPLKLYGLVSNLSLFHYFCLYPSFTGIDINVYVNIYLHPHHLYPCLCLHLYLFHIDI